MDLNDNSPVGSPLTDRTDAGVAGTIQAEAGLNGDGTAHVDGGRNGHLNGHSFGMHELLHALQAMRIGDFSVRLPSDQTASTT